MIAMISFHRAPRPQRKLPQKTACPSEKQILKFFATMNKIHLPRFGRLCIYISISIILFAEYSMSEERVNEATEVRIITSKEKEGKLALSDPALDISIDLLMICKRIINQRDEDFKSGQQVKILQCILPSLEKSIDSIEFKKLERSRISDNIASWLRDFKEVLDASSLLIEARKTEGDRIYPARELLLKRGIPPLDKMINSLTKARRNAFVD